MNVLVDEDLSFLTGLIELATKWEAVGDHLGVPVHQQEAIESGRRGRIQDCLRDMFIWWLRNGKEKTVGKLIKAVHAVGVHDIERKIKRNYGKLKILNFVMIAKLNYHTISMQVFKM